MNAHEIIKGIQNWFHGLVKSLKPALDYAEKAAGEDGLQIAEAVITAYANNTPWGQLIDLFIAEIKKNGKDLLQKEASIVLNLAKANVLAKEQGA